jgi:ArsR family transcriptional regulator, virulence genes transcriptional regulator
MSTTDEFDAVALERKAAAVADILRALANERRLMILCKLVEWGEANVSTLAEAVGLSQSALSQHLAKMRDEGIVAFRRESQTLWYRIADPRIEALFGALHDLFCRPDTKATRRGKRT